ncbi:MAG: o-succinylbenzoic acid synthetase [Puniceicoccaceae bacterium 5H]|nr:MAG: o-succinylbenzoic acid synthetase [Puniceicoccaceae bacterium 5H]
MVPLQTASGPWFERRGILLRVSDGEGREGWGEIAPVPEFGSESWTQAMVYLKESDQEALEHPEAVPAYLTATRFAIETALSSLDAPPAEFGFENTVLLPGGEASLEALHERREQGFRCYKLKLGVLEPAAELALVQALWDVLPEEAELRLDANGSFTARQLRWWLEHLEGMDRIGFIEQPLPPGHESTMQRILDEGGIPLALDESLAGVDGLQQAFEEWRWTGPMILKLSILGALDPLRRRVQGAHERLIASSVFETAIGLYQSLRIAHELGVERAVGYGTLAFFDDGWNGFKLEPQLTSTMVCPEIFREIWNQACHRWSKV